MGGIPRSTQVKSTITSGHAATAGFSSASCSSFTIAEDQFLGWGVSIWEGFALSESDPTVQAEYLALTSDT